MNADGQKLALPMPVVLELVLRRRDAVERLRRPIDADVAQFLIVPAVFLVVRFQLVLRLVDGRLRELPIAALFLFLLLRLALVVLVHVDDQAFHAAERYRVHNGHRLV